MEKKQPPFLKLWRSSIFEGVLHKLGKEDWQTLCALAVYMDENGECYPSQKTLKQILGLYSISAVCERIKNLEEKKWKGEPVIVIIKTKHKNEFGRIVWANNRYRINKKIIGIFYDSSPDETKTTSIYQPVTDSFIDETNKSTVINKTLKRRPQSGEKKILVGSAGMDILRRKMKDLKLK